MKNSTMINRVSPGRTIQRYLALAVLATTPLLASAATTNWNAFFDHIRGAATAATNVICFDGNAGAGGYLTNQVTGEQLPVVVWVTSEGAPSTTSGVEALVAATPAYEIFNGYCDLSGGCLAYMDADTKTCTITLSNLNPTKLYAVIGTVNRNNTAYTVRQNLVQLQGADSFVAAHTAGAAIISTPAPNQVVIAGYNASGDYVCWTDINPGSDGTISLRNSRYTANTAYALSALKVIEIDPVINPVAIVREPVGTNVIKFRAFSLSVQATGTAPQYQWYKVDGGGDIPLSGATGPIYSVASAQLTDTGDYYVIVSNTSNSVQSATVTVTVLDDNVQPTIVQAVGSANFQEITVQFSEIMSPTLPDVVDITIDGGGGLSVTALRYTNNNTVMVITTDLQAQNTAYTVTFPDIVTDLAGNTLAVNNVTFTSWVPNPFGGVVFQVYTNLSTSDNNIGVLTTNDARFPEMPDASFVLSSNNTFEVFPTDTTLREGYGGRLRSLFVPTVSGKFRLFTRSDDSSQIWFNPAGPDPAGKVLVAQETGCCNAFLEPPATQTSAPFDLVAGQGYYLEAVYKEGTGGDFCQVAARLEGDTTPAAALDPLGGTFSAYLAVPSGLVGAPSITTPPGNVSVEQPGSATFTVSAECTPAGPLVYQWQRSDDGGANFVDIPSATGSRYTTGVLVEADDNQDQYRVIVKSHGGEITSTPAILTVTADVTAPRLVSAVGSTNLTLITLTYSEAVDPGAAGDTVTYTVTGPLGDLNVNAATVLNLPATPGIPTRVELVTDARVFGENYVVRVEPDVVADISANANYVTEPYNTAIVAATGVIMPAFYPWQYNDLGILGATNLGTAWIAPGYNDSTWSNGHALFIAKSGTPGVPGIPETNMIAYSQGGSVVLAYYFRTHFELAAYPSNVLALSLRPIIDDGAVFYLNGTEIYSYGMPTPGPYTYNTFANVTGGSDYPFLTEVQLPSWVLTNLVYGDNVLAVEVHQVNSTSSDIAFAVEVSAQIAKIEPPRPVSIALQPVGGTVNEGQSFTFRARGDGAPPLGYQWYLNNEPITGATSSSYVIAAATAGNQGQYRVTISNVVNQVTSDEVTLTVNSDLVRPVVLSAEGGRPTNTTIVVAFSEPMNQALAQTTSNYELLGPGGITIQSAALAGVNVTLTLSGPRVAGENYQLRVKDLTDVAFAPNTIDPNPTTLAVSTVVPVIAIETHPWKYLEQTVSGGPVPCLDGTPWTTAGYDDSTWASGLGVFYGNRDTATRPATEDGSLVQTYVNVFTNASNAIQETNFYFRTTFQLPAETTNGASLLWHGMVDDGAVIYLNGNRIADVGFTTDPAYCTNFSTAGGSQTWTPALAAAGRVIGITGLVPGVNTLAVQVAQNNGTSSDITLGVLLEADVPVLLPTLRYEYGAGTLTLIWNAAGFVLQEADSVDGPWGPSSVVSGVPFAFGPGNKFYQLKK